MGKRICIFGDSITWGAYDPVGGGWATRLRNYFEGSDYDTDIYNLGVSGDTTDDLINRFEPEVKARHPQLIVIAIGINDSVLVHSKDERRVPVNRFKQNLELLISTAKKYVEDIVFIGLTSIDESLTRPKLRNKDKSLDEKTIKEYNQVIKELCLENNLKFITLQEIIEKEDLEDGLHPNSQGHQKIFERIKIEFI